MNRELRTTSSPLVADRLALLAKAICVAAVAGCATVPPAQETSSRDAVARINHVVVIYLENRSFDNLYGEFPGADGIVGLAPERYRQVDSTGAPYTVLPQAPDAQLPANLPNAPFDIEQFVPSNKPTRDLVHRFYQEQAQINGGRMNRFVVVSDAQGLTMGHYHTAALPLAAEARNYTLADHFFHGAFGGSFFNHMYLVSATAPVFANAPDAMRAKVDSGGKVILDGTVTPDGYVVNTAFTVNTPHPATYPKEFLVPNQTMPTIGDRMSDKSVSWVWYSGGWDSAVAGRASTFFQYHHQPFAYFAKYADGTPGRSEHLKDEAEFFAAARAGTLPAVSFVKPLGDANEHPGYTDLVSGERHALALIEAVRNGPNWKDAAIIVTYDENGGFWDHVAPPKGDRWGPGSRIPAIIISPYAKRGFIDHTTYDTMSILAFIEHRFGLTPLGARDAAANDLSNAFATGRD
jgi:phospholipase C